MINYTKGSQAVQDKLKPINDALDSIGTTPDTEQIITTKEKIDDVIKFGIVTAFRYCIGNKLDFSLGVDEDETVIANELYEEMWADEKNMDLVKNKFTKMFNSKGI